MSPSLDTRSSAASRDLAVAELIEELASKLRAGQAVNVEAYIAEHPEQAERLRQLLPTIEVLAELGRSSVPGMASPHTEGADIVAGRLGDFRIVGEIGRGGMGVVYEAEQVSLGRRVALKVLPFAGVLDPRQLQRFRNEAHAAACLNHSGIVPVYYVGCERAVHFYAMQFIEGQSLAQVLVELRYRARRKAAASARPGADARQGAENEGAEPEPAPRQPTAPILPPSASCPSAPSTVQAGAFSTLHEAGGREYFRAVARLGVQAAEALDYAHQLGIVHRDVKPANLLVDAQAHLWVADFGLAQVQKDPGLTLTGDLVGTLRYMSPEQTTTKRGPLDHRTDIYSLGATLYELLTLEPAHGGQDRDELLQRITGEEPRRPRSWSRTIPQELETIVLKALEKDPAARYGTALELADDLRNFLEDRPIRARPASWRQLAIKWTRRHRALAGGAALVFLLAALFAGGSWLWWVAMRTAAEKEAWAALKDAIDFQQEEKWPEALSSIRRAQGVLIVGGDRDLLEQIDERAKDLDMACRLEEARLRQTLEKGTNAALPLTDNVAYGEAFAWYGMDVDSGDSQGIGERLRSRSIRTQLAAVLDEWSFVRRWEVYDPNWQKPSAVAKVADPDPWRNRLRDALDSRDPKELEQLAISAPIDKLAPGTAVFLGKLAYGTAAAERALAVLCKVEQYHPNDYWLHHQIAYLVRYVRPDQPDERIRHWTAAAALRPHSPSTRVHLGIALATKGLLDEAIVEMREAIRLKSDNALASLFLGRYLDDKGQSEEALGAYRQWVAIVSKKSDAYAFDILAAFLITTPHHELRDLQKAIALAKKAVALQPQCGDFWTTLGFAYLRNSEWQKAVAALDQVSETRNPQDRCDSFFLLTLAHCHLGDKQKARACYGKGIKLMEKTRNKDGQLQRLVAEAAEHLGIEARTAGDTKTPVANAPGSP